MRSARQNGLTRRAIVQGAVASLVTPSLPFRGFGLPLAEPVSYRTSTRLTGDWRFGRNGAAEGSRPDIQGAAEVVRLPHTVVPLSWHRWNPAAWQERWAYLTTFPGSLHADGRRTFLQVSRALAVATPYLNGVRLEPHAGGFLPFSREITSHLRGGENDLRIDVDSRWLNVPPAGAPDGPESIDYLLPGGLTGNVEIVSVPPNFLRSVSVWGENVLSSRPTLTVEGMVDSASGMGANARLTAVVRKNARIVARGSFPLRSLPGSQTVRLVVDGLRDIALWSPDKPELYDVEVALESDGRTLDVLRTRTGFRDARFEQDAFYLNGERLRLFGLNRHELFPYLGFSAPDRLQRKDAEILRHRLNCNMVRCAHYPQSPAFLDRCDELGLLVWEEIPGWQYIGDASWKRLAEEDLKGMILRDRHSPSVIVWGVRVNESANDVDFYKRMNAVARSLDATRTLSGTMTPEARANWEERWAEDLFAFDDYHAASDGSVGIEPAVEGHPYLVAEAVGQFNYPNRKDFNLAYKRTASEEQQAEQGIFHAEAHERAAAQPKINGCLGWCAFDYPSLHNASEALKFAGVADFFRIDKLGAGLYRAQADPEFAPFVQPNFYWTFDEAHADATRPLFLFSNCDVLKVTVDDEKVASLVPDRENFKHLKHPPFRLNLRHPARKNSELTIEGFRAGRLLVTQRFSADTAGDSLLLEADEGQLVADGSDMTLIRIRVVDRYGQPRYRGKGIVTLTVTGPAEVIGELLFDLEQAGGSGGVYLRAGDTAGIAVIRADHSVLGTEQVQVEIVGPEAKARPQTPSEPFGG